MLNKEELNLLCDLIGPMNKYDIMSILSNLQDDENILKEKALAIEKLFIKISDLSR